MQLLLLQDSAGPKMSVVVAGFGCHMLKLYSRKLQPCLCRILQPCLCRILQPCLCRKLQPCLCRILQPCPCRILQRCHIPQFVSAVYIQQPYSCSLQLQDTAGLHMQFVNAGYCSLVIQFELLQDYPCSLLLQKMVALSIQFVDCKGKLQLQIITVQ